MPTNVSYEYTAAEKKYVAAKTLEEKIKAIELMISAAPSHKGAQNLRAELRLRLARFKKQSEKQRAKKSGFSLSVKKQGAAQVCLVGTTQTGKSTLLKELTGARVKITSHPFTTKKPEMGILDYKGVKIQMVEIPAVIKNFLDTDLGPTLIAIIKHADLMILLFNNEKEYELLDRELRNAEVNTPFMIYNSQRNLPDIIWEKLNLIKVYTKQPGKEPAYPPVALESGSRVLSLAEYIHKDFIKKFRFARIWGKSVKFPGAQVGLNHKLKDEDIVEIHLK